MRGYSLLSQTELGFLLTPPSGGENAENWKGLESERKLQIKFEVVDRYDPKLVLLRCKRFYNLFWYSILKPCLAHSLC